MGRAKCSRGKVVVDSFSGNEEVAMLFEEIGGGKICPLTIVLYVDMCLFTIFGLVSKMQS